ncbi:hypothetical protein BIW11_01274 [Tropilaelaps mercedesae]|uniref:Uncharacterized protein n=1 Tax=Tropilaelaps mercedesae TaxID=418985 RepID=A0A1V9XGW0_9ACAR|nr:hypothetical protein BIW11_01274 [Tropilaelaps mercedesae]
MRSRAFTTTLTRNHCTNRNSDIAMEQLYTGWCRAVSRRY